MYAIYKSINYSEHPTTLKACILQCLFSELPILVYYTINADFVIIVSPTCSHHLHNYDELLKDRDDKYIQEFLIVNRLFP